jgi:hypothetical protein
MFHAFVRKRLRPSFCVSPGQAYDSVDLDGTKLNCNYYEYTIKIYKNIERDNKRYFLSFLRIEWMHVRD